MAEMSGPWEPSEMPEPSQTMTAPRCRRLPLTNTRVWSGARPLRLGGRTMVAPSLMGCTFTLKEGTTLRNRLDRSLSPWFSNSAPEMTSTGARESCAVRALARVPMVTISSMGPAACAVAATGAKAAIAPNPKPMRRVNRGLFMPVSFAASLAALYDKPPEFSSLTALYGKLGKPPDFSGVLNPLSSGLLHLPMCCRKLFP